MFPVRLISAFIVKVHGVLGAGVPTSYSAVNDKVYHCKKVF